MANTNKVATKVKQTGATPAAPKPATPAVKPASSKPTIFHRMAKFLRETWIELKKTSWPKKDELVKGTILVLVAVAVVAIWIGGLDAIFYEISKYFKLV